MTFLEKVRQKAAGAKGLCRTCANLVKVGPNLIGCEAHDKLILPEYPPYDGNLKCPEWKQTKNEPGEDPGNGYDREWRGRT